MAKTVFVHLTAAPLAQTMEAVLEIKWCRMQMLLPAHGTSLWLHQLVLLPALFVSFPTKGRKTRSAAGACLGHGCSDHTQELPTHTELSSWLFSPRDMLCGGTTHVLWWSSGWTGSFTVSKCLLSQNWNVCLPLKKIMPMSFGVWRRWWRYKSLCSAVAVNGERFWGS